VQVELTPRELAMAVNVGMQRLVASTEAGLNHASTYHRSFLKRLEEETVGACGEIAFSKAFGKYWSPSVNTFHDIADVGTDIEVRSTRLDSGSLIVRDNDAGDRWFVLVTGEPPLMTIRGRILGSEAKKPQYVRDPHGHRKAWFVPQEALQLPRLRS
jgi:hypothetical protein